MRIAYVLTSLGAGGAERQVLGLAHRMRQRGHQVRLFVLLPQGEGDLAANGVEVVHLGFRKRFASSLRGFLHGVQELRSFSPDVIHSHNFHGNMAGRLFGALASRVPVISTIHNVYEGGWPRMLAYRLTDGLSRQTVAVSEAARERYVRLRAVRAGKSHVIPNGIETDAFTPNTERREQIREALGIRDKFVWLAAGRLTEAKDYPSLLRAFAAVSSARPGTILWIAGEGKPEYTARLRALAEELGLGDTVRWLGLRNDLPAVMDAADGFVLSSAWEGMPLVAGEAMCMAKPVVATDVGGVRELVGETGAIVPAKDLPALSAAMLRMMQAPLPEQEQMGKAGRARILANFNMDQKAAEWEQVYAEALK